MITLHWLKKLDSNMYCLNKWLTFNRLKNISYDRYWSQSTRCPNTSLLIAIISIIIASERMYKWSAECWHLLIRSRSCVERLTTGTREYFGHQKSISTSISISISIYRLLYNRNQGTFKNCTWSKKYKSHNIWMMVITRYKFFVVTNIHVQFLIEHTLLQMPR